MHNHNNKKNTNYTHLVCSYILNNTSSNILVLGFIRITYIWIHVYKLIISISPSSDVQKLTYSALVAVQHYSTRHKYILLLGCYFFNIDNNICETFHEAEIYNAAIVASLHTAVIISVDIMITHVCCAIIMFLFHQMFICGQKHCNNVIDMKEDKQST